MPTVKDEIIAIYNTRIKSQSLILNDPHVLFDVICEYIKQNNFKYQGYFEHVQNIAEQPHTTAGYTVNCFALSHLMINVSQALGIANKYCSPVIIKNFSCKKNGTTYGPKESFDRENLESINGNYAFDVHCIAMINGYCFDITLQTKYQNLTDGVDVLNVLYEAIKARDFQTFDTFYSYLMIYGIDINNGGWTLLHHACALDRYEFVEFLLKNNADAYKKDNSELALSSLGILHTKVHMKGLNFSQKGKIFGCLQLQAEMELKKEAAIIIQSAIRGHLARKSLNI